MINQKKFSMKKLIVPKIIQLNENEIKNENSSTDTNDSVKTLIKPKPLNIGLISGFNNKTINTKEKLVRPNLVCSSSKFNQKIYVFDNHSFSK